MNQGRFHERNRGSHSWRVTSTLTTSEKKAVMTLDDTRLHGVVDGSHTLDAILEVSDNLPRNGLRTFS